MFKITPESPKTFFQLAFSRSIFQAWAFVVALVSVLAIFLIVARMDDLIKLLLIIIIFLLYSLISITVTGNFIFQHSKSSKVLIKTIQVYENDQIYFYIDSKYELDVDQLLNFCVEKNDQEEMLGIIRVESTTSKGFFRCVILSLNLSGSEPEKRSFILDSTRKKSFFLTEKMSYETFRANKFI